MRKGQLPAKFFSLIILLVVSIVVFSIIFIIMLSLDITISIDMIYRPMYQPFSSQNFAFALFSSDLNDKLLEYSKTGEMGLKKELEETISFSPTYYKIVVNKKILGNQKLQSEQKYSGYLLDEENNKIKIEVYT